MSYPGTDRLPDGTFGCGAGLVFIERILIDFPVGGRESIFGFHQADNPKLLGTENLRERDAHNPKDFHDPAFFGWRSKFGSLY